MVRHYVGARYVPKLASPVAWAANTSYEALTIVTFNNASYTSRVPVPPTVGDPADNPDYWALTGNYNAQVEQYRQETKTANNILQGNINSEAATRASVDSNLQSQINQIIAPSGEAPSAAEVENARIGADGVTYDTLGDAIRTNDNKLKSAFDNILMWPLQVDNHMPAGCQTNIRNYVEYETGFYRPQSKEIVSEAHTYRTYYIDVLPGESIRYHIKFNGGNSEGALAYCRFLDTAGNIISETTSTAGINNITNTITVPDLCTKMTLTDEYANFGFIVKNDTSSYDILPNISEYIQRLAIDKSRRLKAKSVKTGIYFGYQELNAGATTYSMHVYDVIPGERIHVVTRYASGGSANNTNCVRFYNSDNTIFGIIQNESSGNYTFDKEVVVPWYATTMEVVSDGSTIDVTGDRDTPYVAVENETALFIGDSYVQANSLVTAGELVQKRFSTLLSRHYGWKEINYAVGGMGFIYGETPFIQQLENAISDISYDHSKVGKVFVCGGRNDGSISASDFDADNYIASVKEVITTAHSAYPNADIILIPMMWDSTIPSGNIFTLYCLITEAAYGEDATIVPNGYQWLIGYKGYILPDNVHPNVEGHAMIFDHILNALTTGFSYPYPHGTKLNKINESLSQNDFFTITQENGLLRFQMGVSISNDIPSNTTLFKLEVPDSLNNPVLFTQWGITMFVINNNKEFGAFAVSNSYTDTGYVIEVKSSGIIKAGSYYEYNFSIPFGLQAYASSIT